MDVLFFALIAVLLIVAVAQLVDSEPEPARVRKVREELDHIGYHPLV
jgi:hypothetical protein